MSKHSHHSKTRTTNRVGHVIPTGTETPEPPQLFVPAYEAIQKRAYQIHEQKGGSDLENWLEAERLLKEEHQA